LILGELHAAISQPTTGWGLLLCDYANRNARLIYGPDFTITVSFQHNVTPDVLDIVVLKVFVLLVHVTVSCSHVSALITYLS
jgi:hypothetical protein